MLTSIFSLDIAVLLQSIHQFLWQLWSRAWVTHLCSWVTHLCVLDACLPVMTTWFSVTSTAPYNVSGTMVWVCGFVWACAHVFMRIIQRHAGWGARMTHICVAQTNSQCPWSSIWAACLEKCLKDMRKSGPLCWWLVFKLCLLFLMDVLSTFSRNCYIFCSKQYLHRI